MNRPASDSVRQMHEDNRLAWNQAATFYEQNIEADIAFLRGGGKSLLAPELEDLRDLATWCHRAIHLQCAGGRDTLSLWNQGAKEVIGLDISEKMIEAAQRKSDVLRAPARWYCSDVLEAPHELDGTADLVYTGRGALCWIMDIEGWSKTVARLLKPGARLYLFEGHPLDWVWDLNASELKFDPQSPYGDYFSEVATSEKGWAQTLRLVRFEEYPELYWRQYPNLPAETLRRLPHTFSLLMRRE